MKLFYLGSELNANEEHELFPENEFGFDVTIVFTPESWYPDKTIVCHNVTEVHNLFPKIFTMENDSIAFESDIHGTGMYKSCKDIISTTIELATKLSENY